MLHETLLPVDHQHSGRQSSDSADISIPIPAQPHAISDDEFVRPPDAYIEDILLPPALPLEPQSSAASDSQPPPNTKSVFRQLFTSTLFVYLSVLSVASFTVLALVRRGECSRSIVVYITGNGIVSGLLALLTAYASCSAPVDLSQLAVASERSESVRWVALTCMKQLLGLTDFVFFILGHVAFFSSTSDQCASTSPVLHTFTLASLISGYVGFVVPLMTFLYLILTYRQYIFRPRPVRGQRQRAAHAHEIAACEQRVWTADDAAVQHEDGSSADCCICYLSLAEGDAVLQLPCDHKHIFHQPCITQWLSIRDTCPLCKTRLRNALKRTGRSSAPVGRSEAAATDRARAVPVVESLNEIAPFLPGTMAASFSLTAAYQQSHHEHKQSEEACPSPSPVGTPTLDETLQNYVRRAETDEMEYQGDEIQISVCVGGNALDERPTSQPSDVTMVEHDSLASPVSAVGNARSAAVAAALSRLAAAKTDTSQHSVRV